MTKRRFRHFEIVFLNSENKQKKLLFHDIEVHNHEQKIKERDNSTKDFYNIS